MVLAQKQGPTEENIAAEKKIAQIDSLCYNLLNEQEMFRLILSIKTGFRGSSVWGGIVRCSEELKEKVTAFSLDATTPC